MPADEMEGLCRICVHESHFYKNIYESHIFDDTLFKIINELCQLSIQSGDGMPEFVCIDCYNKVLDFGRFKRTSHMGRVMLLGMKMRLRQAQRSIESADVLANGSESVGSEETPGPVLMCIITQNGLEMTESNVVIKPEIIEAKEDFEQQIIISEAAMNNECGKSGSLSSNLQMNMQEVDPANWKPICDNDINQAINAGNVYSMQQEGSNAENITPKEDYVQNVYISKPGFKPEIWKPGNEDGQQQCIAESEIAFQPFAEGSSGHIVYKDSQQNQVSLISNEHIPTVDMGLNHLVTEVNPSQVQLDMMVAGRNSIPSIIFLGSEPKINTKENACTKCGQQFPGPSELEEHEKKECQSEQYLCSNCGMTFGEKSVLSEHLQMCHSDVASADCVEEDGAMKLMSSCSFVPKTDSSLECKYCGKVFTRSDHLNSHLKDHMEHLKDSIKYYCPGCNKSFVRQYYLTRHKRRCTVLN